MKWGRISICICLCFLLHAGPCFASPLTDFSRGKMAFDVAWNVRDFQGGTDSRSYSVTKAVGNKMAVNYRQLDYHPLAFHAKSREFNLIHKLDDNFQLYAGYSKTNACEADGGRVDKNVAQAGVIISADLNKRITMYTFLGGGLNVANVELGLSYGLSADCELNAIYRHFSVEKVTYQKHKLNLRGFGLGLTWKGP